MLQTKLSWTRGHSGDAILDADNSGLRRTKFRGETEPCLNQTNSDYHCSFQQVIYYTENVSKLNDTLNKPVEIRGECIVVSWFIRQFLLSEKMI